MRRAAERCWRGVAAWLLMLAAGVAAAQTLPAEPMALPQKLYLDAMRPIAEGQQGQDEARASLREMIRKEPQHAGAWLDLALMQCELGHAEDAERLFRVVEERFAPPPVIMEMIAQRRASGCQQWQAPGQLSVSLGRGLDTNLNQGASDPVLVIGSGADRIDLQLLPEYLPRHDQYTLLAIDYWRTIAANGTLAFGQFQAQQNDTLTRYNTASVIGGIDVPWRWRGWNMHGTGSVALLALGGRLYQAQSRLQTELAQPLGERVQWRLAAGVTQAAYRTQPQFDSRTWELRHQWSYQGKWALTQASLSYLSDQALGQRPGGDRQGWLARVNARARLGAMVVGELGWSRQDWRSDTPYSPGLIDAARKQQTHVWRSALTYQLTPAQSLMLEWRRVRNSENISIFQYNGSQVKVSWQWQGGP